MILKRDTTSFLIFCKWRHYIMSGAGKLRSNLVFSDFYFTRQIRSSHTADSVMALEFVFSLINAAKYHKPQYLRITHNFSVDA